jgi:hypothetical protein
MKKSLITSTLYSICLATLSAFDSGTGWKLDADGHVVLKDGNPVYLNASGQEMVLAADTIARTNAEAKEHRIAKEAALEKLKAYEGIDPAKARDALEKIGKIDQKQLIDAGKVDDVKNQITQQFTAQLAERDAANTALQNKLDNMLISNVFSNSNFVREGIAVPSEMFEATFRQNFKVEDGKVVAYDKAGNKISSKERIGEDATAEEAFRILVDQSPYKERILKADMGSGSGNNGGGGNRGTGRIIKRAEYDKLQPHQQAEVSAKVGKGEMQLTD